MKTIRKVFLSFFLLTLFTVYQVSMTTFTHVHYINGVMIVHSHPFSGKNHIHTPGQFVLIGHLSTIHTLKAEFTSFNQIQCPLLYSLLNASPITCLQGVYLTHYNLRAPPILV